MSKPKSELTAPKTDAQTKHDADLERIVDIHRGRAYDRPSVSEIAFSMREKKQYVRSLIDEALQKGYLRRTLIVDVSKAPRVRKPAGRTQSAEYAVEDIHRFEVLVLSCVRMWPATNSGEISDRLDRSVASVNQALRRLRSQGLVKPADGGRGYVARPEEI